jgi:hypothetical protein
MTKHILVLTTVTFALISGAVAARAQEDSDDAAMMRQWEQVQQNPGDEDDAGMMGHGGARHCIRQCMAEEGMIGHGWRKHGMMGRGGGALSPRAAERGGALRRSQCAARECERRRAAGEHQGGVGYSRPAD